MGRCEVLLERAKERDWSVSEVREIYCCFFTDSQLGYSSLVKVLSSIYIELETNPCRFM